MSISKQFVDLPFGMIGARKAGETGSTIVFLHGIPSSSFLWRKVIDHLQQEFTCFAVDMLGYGDSDKPKDKDLSITAQAEYIAQWSEAVGLDEFHLVGHDIGGGVAQLLALRHPEKVRRLVLIDTIAYDSWPVPDIDRLKDAQWDDLLRSRDLRSGFRRALEAGLFNKSLVTDELLEGYVGPFLGQEGRAAYLRCARTLKTNHLSDYSQEIEALSNPTLVLWGQHDQYQELRFGERLSNALANHQLEVCPNGSHFLPEDQPSWVAERIRSFLTNS